MDLIIAAVIFIAAFQQSLTGFGFALVSMPILVALLGIHEAAPLVALLDLIITIINGILWREAIDIREIKRLGIWMALGVPVGIWGVIVLDEGILKAGLGALLVGYALFALFKPEKLPTISRRWAYPAGFLAGVLGGAYNTAGPPLVLYGSLRNWSHERFRAVLQTLFGFAISIVVIGHLIAGHYTPAVLHKTMIALPGMLLAVILGALLDRRIQADHLKKWVIISTLVLGVSLFF